MDKVLFGDNQFFAVNHLSDDKSRQQAMRFKDNASIIKVLDDAKEAGINTFMCTTHDRIADITAFIRQNPNSYRGYKIYPCMPYAHKYANAVTDYGMIGALKKYLPGNIFSTVAKGGMAYVSKDFTKMMEVLIDAEMKMFKGIDTPVIFIQNVLVDLILGLGMTKVFKAYDEYIRKKYEAEPGYITMNLPILIKALKNEGIENPIICSSINKIGFRMSGGKEIYEKIIQKNEIQPIAMQVLAAGALKPKEAIEYIGTLGNIKSVLFGASSKNHIQETKELIEKYLK